MGRVKLLYRLVSWQWSERRRRWLTMSMCARGTTKSTESCRWPRCWLAWPCSNNPAVEAQRKSSDEEEGSHLNNLTVWTTATRAGNDGTCGTGTGEVVAQNRWYWESVVQKVCEREIGSGLFSQRSVSKNKMFLPNVCFVLSQHKWCKVFTKLRSIRGSSRDTQPSMNLSWMLNDFTHSKARTWCWADAFSQ